MYRKHRIANYYNSNPDRLENGEFLHKHTGKCKIYSESNPCGEYINESKLRYGLRMGLITRDQLVKKDEYGSVKCKKNEVYGKCHKGYLDECNNRHIYNNDHCIDKCHNMHNNKSTECNNKCNNKCDDKSDECDESDNESSTCDDESYCDWDDDSDDCNDKKNVIIYW